MIRFLFCTRLIVFVLLLCPLASRAPAPAELLHWFAASTFQARSLGSIHFSVVVHGIGHAPPSSLTCAAGRPLRLLIREKWAVPPRRTQRRLTREPHVTEVGQAESRRVYLTRLSVLPHFPNAPPTGFDFLLRRDHGV